MPLCRSCSRTDSRSDPPRATLYLWIPCRRGGVGSVPENARSEDVGVLTLSGSGVRRGRGRLFRIALTVPRRDSSATDRLGKVLPTV